MRSAPEITRLDSEVMMKDSGIPWLGEVPAYWSTWKITHGFRRIGSGTTPKSDNSYYYGGDIPWVTTSELRERVIDDTIAKVTTTAIRDYPALHIYPSGTLLFAMYGATIGRLGILGIPAAVNQACVAFSDPFYFDIQFVYYWFQMRKPVLLAFSAGGGQPNLSQEDLRQVRIPVPSIDEQRAIADYLDRETARLDALVAAKERLLELLAEKRQALITRAVSRGLDPNAPLRDSGIPWLGKIPAHWDIVQVKMAYSIQLGKMLQNHPIGSDDIEVPYLKAQHVQWFSVRVEDAPKMWASPRELHQYSIRAGDLLVCEGGEGGRCSLVTDIQPNCIIQNALHRVRGLGKGRNDYLQYVMSAIATTGWFDAISSKATIVHFTKEKFGALMMPLPSLIEQRAIVDYLDRETAQLDTLTAITRDTIALIKERRAALIAAAVTGRIDTSRSMK